MNTMKFCQIITTCFIVFYSMEGRQIPTWAPLCLSIFIVVEVLLQKLDQIKEKL